MNISKVISNMIENNIFSIQISLYIAIIILKIWPYIDDFYNDQLIDLTDAAYKVALDRSIEKIGIKLKEIYTRLYENRK